MDHKWISPPEAALPNRSPQSEQEKREMIFLCPVAHLEESRHSILDLDLDHCLIEIMPRL
jgi:hypothetical protein